MIGGQGLCEAVVPGEPKRLPEMEAYDLLPPSFRAVLREGPQDWGAAQILERFQRFTQGQTPAGVARLIEEFAEGFATWDRRECRTGRTTRMLDAIRQGIDPDEWESMPATPHMLAHATMQKSIGDYENGERYKAMNRGNKRRD